jgi:hypothetical protein
MNYPRGACHRGERPFFSKRPPAKYLLPGITAGSHNDKIITPVIQMKAPIIFLRLNSELNKKYDTIAIMTTLVLTIAWENPGFGAILILLVSKRFPIYEISPHMIIIETTIRSIFICILLILMCINALNADMEKEINSMSAGFTPFVVAYFIPRIRIDVNSVAVIARMYHI